MKKELSKEEKAKQKALEKQKDFQIKTEMLNEQLLFKKNNPHTRLQGVFLDTFHEYNNRIGINRFQNAIHCKVIDLDILNKLKKLNKK